ncbi:MAG: mechanosensitive ion channel [Anaerolineales bacterium]|nr:mechanosensitive ion channel [Anaerolineales bacterium]
MPDQVVEFLTTNPIWIKLARIFLFIIIALIFYLLRKRLAHRIVNISRLSPANRRPERQSTLELLLASAITVMAFALATLASLGQFVKFDTLVWMAGLFSAAFGLGARPLISDVLTGIGLIFEDAFSVGEKIQIQEVEGIVEAVNLRATLVRAPTGELFTVPNGEIRIVRNFSRGLFSIARIKLNIDATNLEKALPYLENLGIEAVTLLPNLLEPWQVLSETGAMGQHTELTIIAKARFGKAGEMRPRLILLVQERLLQIGIQLD